MKNAEKIQFAGQQFLPSSICSGIQIQGLVGKSVDGKASTEPVGLFGLDSKRTAIPSLFSNVGNINLVPGQQAYAANDSFFLKPQLDNLQQDETRRWINDGNDEEEDGRIAQRHIRRSDLFPSLKQRGRHQHRNSHRWHDKRHDRRDYATREFKDHSRDHSRRSGSRGNRTGNLYKHQYFMDGPSKECHHLSDIKAGIQFGVKSDLESVFNPVVKSEMDGQKTFAEVENQHTEAEEQSDVLDSAVSASEEDCS